MSMYLNFNFGFQFERDGGRQMTTSTVTGNGNTTGVNAKLSMSSDDVLGDSKTIVEGNRMGMLRWLTVAGLEDNVEEVISLVLIVRIMITRT